MMLSAERQAKRSARDYLKTSLLRSSSLPITRKEKVGLSQPSSLLPLVEAFGIASRYLLQYTSFIYPLVVC